MSTKRLTGYEAIDYAEQTGQALCKYADPTEGALDDMSPSEARDVAGEDPGLIYIDVNVPWTATIGRMLSPPNTPID